jgi:hypothetical protein
MKSKLLCLAMVLSASLSVVRVTTKPTLEPVQQNCETEAKSLTLSCDNLATEETNPENTQKDSPKPTKKKRHLAAKIITGIGVAFGLVVAIFVLSYTAAQH